MSETKKGKTSKPEQPPVVGRVARLMLKSLLVAILALVLFLFGINAYLKSNKTKIFDSLTVLNNASLSFDEARISVFDDFPSATISLDNVVLRDPKHGQPIAAFQQLTAAVTLEKLLDHRIEIRSVNMQEGSITIFTDETGYNNLKSIVSGKKNEQETQKGLGLEVAADNLRLTFSDVNYHFTDAIKTTSIHGGMDEVSADLRLKKNGLSATIDLSLFMEELVFKKEKGSFVANSNLAGKVSLELENGTISFEPFLLSINDERFLFSGIYDTKKGSASTLILENEKTRWAKVFPLLPDNLQQKLKPHHVAESFYSKTTITGHFRPGEQPLITIDFRFDENEVSVDNLTFEQVKLTGRFVNRIYDDERSYKEDRKNFRIFLQNINAAYNGVFIESDHALIVFTPKNKMQIQASLEATGPPLAISKWFQNDKFFFRNGRFKLNAKMQGPLMEFKKLIISSEAHLTLSDFSVIYDPSNTAFPFKKLILYKKRGDADFSIISSTLQSGHDFRIDGGLKNMQALLFAMSQRASSDISFVAEKISWADFLSLFGENGYLDADVPKSDQQKKKSMKETIRGVQYNFQPRISVEVDTLQYFDLLELHDFKTGVHFENEHIVVLEKTTFNYGEGHVDFRARLDISNPDKTPFEFELYAKKINLEKLLPPFDYFKIKLLSNFDELPENVSIDIKHKGVMDDQKGLIPSTSTGEIIFKIDTGETLLGRINYEPAVQAKGENAPKFGGSVKTKIALDGAPHLFNGFFKTDQFFFDKGHFSVLFEYNGDMTDFEELLSNADATFAMQNSEVYYKPGNVTFPLAEINLELHEDNADFNVSINSDSLQQELNLIGNIQHLSELLIENTGKNIKTKVEVTSPIIAWGQFIRAFSSPGADKPGLRSHTVKATTKGILSTFNPDVFVYLDTFVYSDKLTLHKVQTRLSLKDTSILVLDKTGFKFHGGSMNLQGTLDLGKKGATPFAGNFQTTDLDVAKLIEGLNYLHLPSLENIEKLSGQTTMNLDLAGVIDKGGTGLVAEATAGSLDFELNNVTIKGFAPLDAITAKIGKKERFEELRFGPIANRVEIKGKDIHIPLMEIQSNAIDMFIEGTFSYGDNTDMWVSIPLDNIKSTDLSIIPEKRGYWATKRKIYIRVTTDENNENELKIHLRKKKFYKERGTPEQYRKDKRRDRKTRKEEKRGGG